jgi:hypothetical protein
VRLITPFSFEIKNGGAVFPYVPMARCVINYRLQITLNVPFHLVDLTLKRVTSIESLCLLRCTVIFGAFGMKMVKEYKFVVSLCNWRTTERIFMKFATEEAIEA